MGTDSDREKNTQLLGLINILGDDYTNIYLVNRKTQQIERSTATETRTLM